MTKCLLRSSLRSTLSLSLGSLYKVVGPVAGRNGHCHPLISIVNAQPLSWQLIIWCWLNMVELLWSILMYPCYLLFIFVHIVLCCLTDAWLMLHSRRANFAGQGKLATVGVGFLRLDPVHSAFCMIKHSGVHNTMLSIGNSFAMANGTSNVASCWVIRRKFDATNSTGLIFAQPIL